MQIVNHCTLKKLTISNHFPFSCFHVYLATHLALLVQKNPIKPKNPTWVGLFLKNQGFSESGLYTKLRMWESAASSEVESEKRRRPRQNQIWYIKELDKSIWWKYWHIILPIFLRICYYKHVHWTAVFDNEITCKTSNANKRAQLSRGKRATAVRVWRPLGKKSTFSRKPNPGTLEPTSTSIGKAVAKLWPFSKMWRISVIVTSTSDYS